MDIVIIEDELLAAERLQLLIREYDPSIRVVACLESIGESVQWLQTHAHPDLLLVDIHLSDGHSFEIFNRVQVNIPVIFTTAYDQYALEAFRLFSIDYVLKPITPEALATAMNKFRQMAAFLLSKRQTPLMQANTTADSEPAYKNRFLAKVGQRSFFIQAEDVVYFYAENKVVYLVDREGNRYIINHTLDKLEPRLNPCEFFRVNRKMIVHSKAIEQVKPYYNNRLKLMLKHLKNSGDIIISRERVPGFRDWAEAW
jgi:DNA-binding LytR/AlgR family response regulator